MRSRPWLSALALCATTAWGLWILSHARSKQDYVEARVQEMPPLAWCQWQEPSSAQVSSLGLVLDADNAWSDRSTALLAFPMQTAPSGAWLDLDIVAVAAQSMTLQLQGSEQSYVISKPGKFRLAVPPSTDRSVVLLRMVATAPALPKGDERRWLGAALAQLRVCKR